MKHLLSSVRTNDDKYGMIVPEGRVAVGVSGGKDSLALLTVLAAYRRVKPFYLQAITVLTPPDMDVTGIRAYCESLEVPFTCVPGPAEAALKTQKNPCSLCARLRRGILIQTASALGCDTLALGHHREDANETLLLNVLMGGKMVPLSPCLPAGRQGVRVIRPLLSVPEAQLTAFACRRGLPVTESMCPYAGHTARQDMKELMEKLTLLYPDAQEKIFAAAQALTRTGHC